MGKVCYSLSKATVNNCNFMVHTRGDQAVEIRLDLCGLDDEDIKEIFSRKRSTTLIATYHTNLPSEDEQACEALITAILAGTDYVDIDFFMPKEKREFLTSLAFSRGSKVIISYHDNKGTKPTETLVEVVQTAVRYGADIVKVVTTAHNEDDANRVLSLYDRFDPEKLIAFAMGEQGYDSRLLSFEKGAPFFFVSPTRNGITGNGQPTCFDFMDEKEIIFRGDVMPPASKSCAQRAILFAALSEGTTKLFGVDLCEDIESAVGVARTLYADVVIDGTTMTITGHQNIARDGLRVRDNVIFVGESALLARFCIPLAGLCPDVIRIEGDKTLLCRKIDEHRGTLRKLGLKMKYTDKHYLPVEVGGRLHGKDMVTVSGESGSQMISGLLVALSQCMEETFFNIENVTSEPYIDLTTYIASFFGIEINPPEYLSEDDDDPEDAPSHNRSFIVSGGQRFSPVIGMGIERDWSAAAMMMVLAAISGDITIHGLDTYSRQADAIIYDILDHCKVDLCQYDDGSINVRKSIITPFFFDITDSPDLFAPLFILALRAEGESVIGGIRRLRNKESDRLLTFVTEFRKLGANMVVDRDELIIWGHERLRLTATRCSSHGDHRLAMALCAANFFTDGEIEIDDLDCITKSYPGFIDDLLHLAQHLKTQEEQ